MHQLMKNLNFWWEKNILLTLNLNSPTGGSAYRIPRNEKNSVPFLETSRVPRMVPMEVFTIGASWHAEKFEIDRRRSIIPKRIILTEQSAIKLHVWLIYID